MLTQDTNLAVRHRLLVSKVVLILIRMKLTIMTKADRPPRNTRPNIPTKVMEDTLIMFMAMVTHNSLPMVSKYRYRDM